MCEEKTIIPLLRVMTDTEQEQLRKEIKKFTSENATPRTLSIARSMSIDIAIDWMNRALNIKQIILAMGGHCSDRYIEKKV